ncbi:hypothetical protein ACLB2K_003545 [Fragaria x ananassa]
MTPRRRLREEATCRVRIHADYCKSLPSTQGKSEEPYGGVGALSILSRLIRNKKLSAPRYYNLYFPRPSGGTPATTKRDFARLELLEWPKQTHHFALNDGIKTVQKLFAMVRQSGVGVQPDAYIFKVLIQAYCKCERTALMYRAFEDLRNLNLLPNPATKELLVKSLWKEGKRREAAAHYWKKTLRRRNDFVA